MKVVFNFGGFYHSHYSDVIDSVFEDETDTIYDEIDFNKVHLEVSKAIVVKFQEFLKDTYDLDITLEFVSLDSPKTYNFATNTIILNIFKKDLLKIDLLIESNDIIKDLLESKIQDVTTSRDGYIAFYNYNDVINKKDGNLKTAYYECVFDVLRTMNLDSYYDTTLDGLSESVYSVI